MLKKIDSELSQEEIYQEVIELIKNHPDYNQYYNDFINSNFVSFFNFIFSNIMTSLQNKLEIYFNNHFPTTIYDKDFGFNLLNFIGYNPKCITAAEVDISFYLQNLPTNADPTIQLNQMVEGMNYPIYFSFEAKNKNGETNNWELLQKDENGEFDYLFAGNYKFDEFNCKLENNLYVYKNKIKFYSGTTKIQEYITEGINNEEIIINTGEENIQLNSIRVYKVKIDNTLISMRKVENFIEENYNSETYLNNLELLPYIVLKKDSKNFIVQFGHKAYTNNRIPKKNDKFIVFYRINGGSLDNISAFSININNKTIIHKINGSNENTELIYMKLKNLSDAKGGLDNENPLEAIFTQVQRQKTFSYSGLRLKQETDYKVLLEDERSDILLSASYGLKHTVIDGLIYGEEDYIKSDDVFIYLIPKKDYLSSSLEYDVDALLDINNMIIVNYPVNWQKQIILGEESYYFKLPYNYIDYNVEDNEIKYNLFLTNQKIYKYTNIYDDIKTFNSNIGIEFIESIKENVGYCFNAFNYENSFWESLTSGEGTYLNLESLNNLTLNNYTIEIVDETSAPKSWNFEGYNSSINQWEILDTQEDFDWSGITKQSFNLTSNKTYKKFRFNDLLNDNNNPIKIKFIELRNLEDKIQYAILSSPDGDNINYLKNDTDLWEANDRTCKIYINFTEKTYIDTIIIKEPSSNYNGAPLIFTLSGCDVYTDDDSFEIIQEFQIDEDNGWSEDEIQLKINYPVKYKYYLLRVTYTLNNYYVKILQLQLKCSLSLIPNMKHYIQNDFTISSNSENLETLNNFEIIQYNGELYLKAIPKYVYNLETQKYENSYNIDFNKNWFINYKRKKYNTLAFNDIINFQLVDGKFISYIQNDNVYEDKTTYVQNIKLTHFIENLAYDDIVDDFIQQRYYTISFDEEIGKIKIQIEKDYIVDDILRNNGYLYAHYLKEYENNYKNVLSYEDEILEYLQGYSLMNIENKIKQPIIVPFSLKITLYMYENPYIEQIENEVVTTLREKYSLGALEFGESIPVEQITAIINNISQYISYGKVDYFGKSYQNYQKNISGFENLNYLTVEQNQIAVLQKDEKTYDYNSKKYITYEGIILNIITVRSKS